MHAGLVRALGATTAAVIGHDWGSLIAANAALLLEPDTFTAVATLSAPYTPRGRAPPRRDLRPCRRGRRVLHQLLPAARRPRRGGDRARYPGLAARLLRQPVRVDTMPSEGAGHVFYISTRRPDARDRFVSGELPAWLSDDDLDVYTSRSSNAPVSPGALNRYRNVDRDWEDLAGYDGEAAITQASLFIGGALDASLARGSRTIIDSFSTTMPGLVSSHLLPGCGHWVPEERPAHVTEILLEWLPEVHPATG